VAAAGRAAGAWASGRWRSCHIVAPWRLGGVISGVLLRRMRLAFWLCLHLPSGQAAAWRTAGGIYASSLPAVFSAAAKAPRVARCNLYPASPSRVAGALS